MTAETKQAINSEISSQMSRKLEEVRIELDANVLEAINSTIEEKVLPTIQNALNAHSLSSSAKLVNLDIRSVGSQQSENGGMSRRTRVGFRKLNSVKSYHNNHTRESSVDSFESEESYDSFHLPGKEGSTLECIGKLNLLKAHFCAFNTSDCTTIPLTVQNWQITS